MSKLERVQHKIFAENAPLDEIGQFGSAKATTKKKTQDVEQIQALDAYEEGWGSAVISSKNYPPLEEMNGVLKTMSYQTGYLFQEGIATWSEDTEYQDGSIVKILSDGVKLYVSKQDGNIGNTIDNADYWEELKSGGGSMPLLSTIWSEVPLNDANLHIKDGSLILGSGIYQGAFQALQSLQSTNPELFCTQEEFDQSITTYGECGKFVLNSDSFRIPKQISYIKGTDNSAELGTIGQAGLPNITGTITNGTYFDTGVPTMYGAFSKYDGSASTTRANLNAGTQSGINFNASMSNSIYGNSNTVTPQHIKGYYYIVLATGQAKTEAEIEIDNIVADLNGKADTNLSNLNQTGTTAIAHYAMPSDRYINLTLGSSGTAYTAPADGYFLISKFTGTNAVVEIAFCLENSYYKAIATTTNSGNAGEPLTLFLPVKKGDTRYLLYSTSGAVNYFRFIYAEGSY